MMRHDRNLLVRALDAAVLERADIRSLLASIEADTIVLSGALDQATPSELGEEIAAALPRARHEVVPGAAHHLPAEAAAPMNRAIDGALGHEAWASSRRMELAALRSFIIEAAPRHRLSATLRQAAPRVGQ